jgi:hypothetical protein
VDCAAGGTGVAIRREVVAEIQSFELSGARPVARRVLASAGAIGNTVLVSPANAALYALTSYGELEFFDYDVGSGGVGAAARRAIPIGNAGSSVFGIDTMALTGDGRKLFVSQLPGKGPADEDGVAAPGEPGRVQILDARTGALVASIERPRSVAPRGICLPRFDAVRVEIETGPEGEVLSPLSDTQLPVVIFGSDEFDVRDVDAHSLGFGPDAAEPSQPVEFEDVDDDGFDDLVSLYAVPETGISFGDTEACIRGERAGTVFQGCDAIETLPPPVAASSLADPEDVGTQAPGSACGFGFELALVVPVLMWLRRRRHTSA